MNAFNLYDAVFDSARAEFVPAASADKIEDVIDYAQGALDLHISRDVAQKIVAAHDAFEASEQGSDNFWHLVEQPLAAIEL